MGERRFEVHHCGDLSLLVDDITMFQLAINVWFSKKALMICVHCEMRIDVA